MICLAILRVTLPCFLFPHVHLRFGFVCLPMPIYCAFDSDYSLEHSLDIVHFASES